MYYTLQKVLQMTLEQETRIENKTNGLKLKKIMQEKKQMAFIIRSEYFLHFLVEIPTTMSIMLQAWLINLFWGVLPAVLK